MPYLDSNVFLYALLYDVQAEPKAERARQILLRIELGELLASTSTLTWDEVVWVTSKVMGKTEGINQGGKLLGFPNLDFVNSDMNVLTKAQVLIGRYNLTPRDSIHGASALHRKEKNIFSDVKNFDKVVEIKGLPI